MLAESHNEIYLHTLEKVVRQCNQSCWCHRLSIAYFSSQNPPSSKLLKPWLLLSTNRWILLHYSATDPMWKIAPNDVNIDDVTITMLRFRGKKLLYFDPVNIKMNTCLIETSLGWFLCRYSRFKCVYFLKILLEYPGEVLAVKIRDGTEYSSTHFDVEYSSIVFVLEYSEKILKNRIFGFIKLKFILYYPLTTSRVIRRVLTVLLKVSLWGGYLKLTPNTN